MEEAIGPTIERLRKGEFDRPEVNQGVQRRAYRARDPFLSMLQNQEIDGAQFQQAEKFEQFYFGADGHDVRIQDYSSVRRDSYEFERTFFATSVADAKKILSSTEFKALELMVRDGFTLVQVGSALSSYENRQQAKAYGLAVVRGALQRLVDLWITERKRPPSR